MLYRKRWHYITGSLACTWNNSLEKAWGKAASPFSNQPPPLGQGISDSLACACLLAHVFFHSDSKDIQEALQWRFHCKSMTRHGASTDQVLRNHWLRRVPHPLWHPWGCLASRAVIYRGFESLPFVLGDNETDYLQLCLFSWLAEVCQSDHSRGKGISLCVRQRMGGSQ